MVIKKKAVKKKTVQKKKKFGKITTITQKEEEKVIARLPIVKVPKQQKLEDFSMENFEFPPLEESKSIDVKKISFWEKILGKSKRVKK